MRLGLLLASCLILSCACDEAASQSQRYLSGESAGGRIVDMETGAPIAGANVLAAWDLRSGLEGGIHGYAHVLEAVSDEGGRFLIPSWGPKLVTERGSMESRSPTLTIFKSGYELGGLGDAYGASPTGGPPRDAQTFKLRRFVGTQDQYARYLSMYLGVTINGLLQYGCHAKDMPRFLLEVDRQNRIFATQGMGASSLNLDGLSESFANNCGDFSKAIRRFGR